MLQGWSCTPRCTEEWAGGAGGSVGMQEGLEMREGPVASAGLGPESYLARVCKYTQKLQHGIPPPPRNAFAGLALPFLGSRFLLLAV